MTRSGKTRQEMTPAERRQHNQERRARARERREQERRRKAPGPAQVPAYRPAAAETVYLPDVHMTNETAPDPAAVARALTRFRADLARSGPADVYREGLEHHTFVAWVSAAARAPTTTVDLAGVEERLPLTGVAVMTVGFTGRRRGRGAGVLEVVSALSLVRWLPAGAPGTYRLVADRPVARSVVAGDRIPTFAPAEAGWATAALWGVAQLLTLAAAGDPGDEIAPAVPTPERLVFGGYDSGGRPRDPAAVPMTGAEYDPATGLFRLAPDDDDPSRTYLNFGVETARQLGLDTRYEPPLSLRQTAGWGLLRAHVRAVWRQIGPVTVHAVTD